jgi:hypothetical protein
MSSKMLVDSLGPTASDGHKLPVATGSFVTMNVAE